MKINHIGTAFLFNEATSEKKILRTVDNELLVFGTIKEIKSKVLSIREIRNVKVLKNLTNIIVCVRTPITKF